VSYLSVTNFWKYQNADVWKKTKIHPPWFKHYVHRDPELDKLEPAARLLFWEILAAATRYSNVLERDLNWLYAETRVEPELIAEHLPHLVKGGWLSETKSKRRSRGVSRLSLEDPRDQDVEVEVDNPPNPPKHKPTPPTHYDCPVEGCSRTTRSQTDLDVHLEVDHNVVPLRQETG
jgi:hypothetical protein